MLKLRRGRPPICFPPLPASYVQWAGLWAGVYGKYIQTFENDISLFVQNTIEHLAMHYHNNFQPGTFVDAVAL